LLVMIILQESTSGCCCCCSCTALFSRLRIPAYTLACKHQNAAGVTEHLAGTAQTCCWQPISKHHLQHSTALLIKKMLRNPDSIASIPYPCMHAKSGSMTAALHITHGWHSLLGWNLIEPAAGGSAAAAAAVSPAALAAAAATGTGGGASSIMGASSPVPHS
jgi:hypothetical protein